MPDPQKTKRLHFPFPIPKILFFIATTGNIKNPGIIFAEMQGTIMDTMTKQGKKVKKGDSLFVLEAMKMENVITAPIDGVIKKFNIEKGQPVKKGDLLIEIEAKF